MIIPGYNKYSITEAGVITEIATGKVVEPVYTHLPNGSYYLRVNLKNAEGRSRMCNVMKLMADTYLSKPSKTAVVHAKDGDNLNVALSNIEYITRVDLSKQAWQEGKMASRRPKQRCWSELTIEIVYDYLSLLGVPSTMVDIGAELGLTYSTVRYSIAELCRRELVRKTEAGFEVIM